MKRTSLRIKAAPPVPRHTNAVGTLFLLLTHHIGTCEHESCWMYRQEAEAGLQEAAAEPPPGEWARSRHRSSTPASVLLRAADPGEPVGLGR
jgi:hypothetical protein